MGGGRKREGERQREGCFRMEISEHVCPGEEAHGKGKVEDRLERRSLMEQCQKRWWLRYGSLRKEDSASSFDIRGKETKIVAREVIFWVKGYEIEEVHV